MRKILLVLLFLAILLAAFYCAALGALLLDPIELDFSLMGRLRYSLGIEPPNRNAAIVRVYEWLLYGAAGGMAVLIGRQLYVEIRTKRGGMADAYRQCSRRMQVILGGMAALLLLGAGALLAIQAGVLLALVPGAVLVLRWTIYMLSMKARRE